ncbi:MAG: urate hydroxylase PuuD, partial [Gammaproteobacteria bacterium]|nr:urate hydroxylase PuuD [Gammaproteobacteria bacterium]
METYLLDWVNLLVRWIHLITGVAWIGASFYFVMLDMSLRKAAKKADQQRGVSGELWAVHGGGVYQSQKFLSGPIGEPLSDKLHWSKWEAYSTWLSGMGLLIIIYWFGARTYLIDQNVLQLSVAQAISVSALVIAISWLIYDLLCRFLGSNENLLAALIFIYILLCDWILFQVFSARAAYIHVGAIMGSIMVANVFFHIIPGQKKMVQEIRAGLTPNPEYGRVGKQRSVHNTYFTLPVLFVMISNHYPMTYSHQYGWVVLALI